MIKHANGGFDARRSDIDALVVCEHPMTADEQTAAAERLSDDRLPCPAHGLELSVVTLPVTLYPKAQPPFELHVTTAPDNTKVVDGHGHEGDPAAELDPREVTRFVHWILSRIIDASA
ncbi:hypothetical protein AB0392_05035 [Nonomuraea angiospora]|uniref:hypothetical protein n=1 Tax=Nonomuraea angiospora TaxID=46172 RepID=UPI00344B266A